MIPIEVDERGYVRGFPYHDGSLEGIVSSAARREARLALVAEDGSRRVVTLRGVRALAMDQFREGNIVGDLRLLSVAQASADAEVARRIEAKLFLEPSSIPEAARIFLLESSYGAELVAICDGIEVSDLAGEVF
jgi:hypothetical protein